MVAYTNNEKLKRIVPINSSSYLSLVSFEVFDHISLDNHRTVAP